MKDPVICRNLQEALQNSEFQTLVKKTDKVCYLTDSNVAKLLPEGIDPLIVIPAGEEHKTLSAVERVWRELIRLGATRHSLLVNIGGGMVTDLGGFAAATFKRGIPCVNIATTLLCGVDASIGGKTGVDFDGLKNEIGVFRDPEMTLIPIDMLDTLPEVEFLSGVGELLKYAFITDDITLGMCVYILEHRDNKEHLGEVIRKSLDYKRRIVQEDPTERGMRKVLNFGHTAGHALESFLLETGKGLPHGVCVAYGILVELMLSHREYGYPLLKVRQYQQILKEHFPSITLSCKDLDRVIEIAKHDKKNRDDGEISFVGLRAPGILYLEGRATPTALRAVLELTLS